MMIKILIILLLTSNIFASIKDFEKFAQKEVKNKRPPSVSFALLKDNHVVYASSMGYNDANMTQASNHNSVYHVYSLTKILTATVVMQLVEEKKLSLDDPLQKFFPNFRANYKGKEVNITLLNLLNHSSGIKDRMEGIPQMLEGNENNRSISLPYMPGSEAKYSSAEYIILGKIIEKVTMEEFGTVVKNRILRPTKMQRSDFTYSKKLKKNQVYGTIPFFSLIGTVMRTMIKDESKDFYEGTMLWLKQFDIAWKPAGGLISSVDDMTKFLIAYNKNQLFSEKTKKLFTSLPTVPVHSWISHEDSVAFGIGWYHIHNHGEFYYQHQGVGPGFRTIMRIYPKRNISLVILSSQTSIEIDEWADRLFESIL